MIALLSLATCCSVASGFLAPRSFHISGNLRPAVWRGKNMINPASTRPRSSISHSIGRDRAAAGRGIQRDDTRLSSPATFSCRGGLPPRPTRGGRTSARMERDGGGHGQQEKSHRERKEEVDLPVPTADSTADRNYGADGRDGADLLPKTLAGGRYLVRGVLGTGGTASTYRCTAARHHGHQREQKQQREGAATRASASPTPTWPAPAPRQERQQKRDGPPPTSRQDTVADARHAQTGVIDGEDEVAVKVLTLRGMRNWKQLDLFQREAKVLKSLRHPGIPRYLESFEEDTGERGKTFLLVQQLAPGLSLGQMVESGWRPTEAEVRRIAEELLDILDYLHELRPPIVHRDIKPENIVIEGGRSGGRVFLVDFGGVQDAVADKPSSTIIGTYGYMSPEQFRGEAVPESDLYGLGGTLLFLLSGGRHPSDFQAARMEVSFRGRIRCEKPLEMLLTGLLEPFPEDRLSAKQSLHLLRDGLIPDLPAASDGSVAGGERNGEGGVADDVGAPQIAGGVQGGGGGLFGQRQPAGARASIRREGGTLVVEIPPEGLSGGAVSVGAFAVAWNSIVMGMTASILTGGASTLFQAIWMAPFWFAGGKLSLETVRRICLWERLEVGTDRWSLNQRLAPLRRISSSSSSRERSRRRDSSFSIRRSTRRGTTESSQAASVAASWEADWYSAKVGEAGVTGNTDDLVACRSFVERDSKEDGRTVEKWTLQIVAGVERHEFGETLPPEEQMWIAAEVDNHIQACLMQQAGGGDGGAEMLANWGSRRLE